MTYDEISPVMRDFLGAREGFRKVGFTSEQLYCSIARSVMAGGALSCFVVLKAQRKIFTLEVGIIEDQDAFTEEWEKVCAAVNGGAVSEADAKRIWQESLPYREKVAFVAALMGKGFKLPKSMS